MTQPIGLSGTRGIIVSSHHQATLAGWDTYEHGGAVVDAVIAAAAVLTVVAPHACTIGGDAFALIHDSGAQKTLGLNASGPAPLATSPGRFRDGIPERGPLSVTVPGVVAGWEAAHRRFGRVDWEGLFEPAVRLAERGFPVSSYLASVLTNKENLLARDQGCRAIFLPNGAPLKAGEILRQPQLAETLRDIARDGSSAFYNGRPAVSAEQTMAEQGGSLVAADFESYQPTWVQPIETEYRGHAVAVMPPNSFGLYMLLQLNALAEVDLQRYGSESPERFAALVLAARRAFEKGAPYVADPKFAFGPPDAVLRGKYGSGQGEPDGHDAAQAPSPNRGGTATVSVADHDGNGVTFIQSIFLPFGSGVMDPNTGVLYNNRMIGFTSESGRPNSVAAGKLPAHTLNPAMAFAGGKLRYLLGTPGGPGQTLTLTQILSNLVDYGMDISSAVAAPRWSMDLKEKIILEREVPDAVITALGKRGIEAGYAAPGAPFFGSAEVIEIRPGGGLRGVADHRREAATMGS